MSVVKLMVLYPQPKNVAKFEIDYQAHLDLFHNKMGIPKDVRDYTVTKMHDSPAGPAPFYQMFSFAFPSIEALQQTLASAEMQAVAADANRISSGGQPVILVGHDEV